MPVDPSQISTFDRVGYFISNVFLQGILKAASLMPYETRVRSVGWLVSRVSRVAGWHKRIRANLQIAAPDLPEAEIERLCNAVTDNAGRTVIELYSGEEFADRARRAPIHGPGLAALEEARAQGRPVVLITAHFGNYDVARVKLFSLGHPMGALYRRMANPYFNDHYVATIKALGEPMFEQGRRGMAQMVRHLKNGGTIAIVSDLHAHGGQELTFFNQPAVTSVMNAELALKYDALVIPVYSVRRENGFDFDVIMNAPIPQGDPADMTQALNDDLEALVREHMDQWFWIHRRWKPWNGLGIQPEDD